MFEVLASKNAGMGSVLQYRLVALPDPIRTRAFPIHPDWSRRLMVGRSGGGYPTVRFCHRGRLYFSEDEGQRLKKCHGHVGCKLSGAIDLPGSQPSAA